MDQPLPTQPFPPPPAPAGAALVPPHAPGGFGIGRVVSRTFRVWWQGALGFVVLGVLAHLPSTIGTYLIYTRRPELLRGPRPEEIAAATSFGEVMGVFMGHTLEVAKAFLPHTAVLWALQLVVMGAIAHGVARRLQGERPGLGAMVGAGLRAWPAVLGAAILFTLASVPAAVLIVPAFILALGWSVTVPAVVVERLGPLAALARSWRLTAGHRGRLFVAFLVIWLAMAAVVWMVQIPYTIYVMVQTIQRGVAPDPAVMAWPTAVAGLVGGVAQTLFLVAPAVAHRELRDVKEGRDPAVLARVFE